MKNMKVLGKYKIKKEVLFSLLFLLLLFVTFLVKDKYFFDVTVDKTSPLISVGENGWDYGRWEMASEVLDNGNVLISDDGSQVSISSTSEVLEDNEVILSTWGILENDSLKVDIKEKEFMLNLPLYLFLTNQYEYPVLVDEESNVLKFLSDDDKVLGYAKLPSEVAYCDYNISDCSSLENEFLWMYDEYSIYIYNNKDILTSVQDYSFTFDVVYSFVSSEIVLNNSNDIFPYISFADIEFVDFPYISFIKTIPQDAGANLEYVEANQEVIYTDWQDKWGILQEEYDFYIEYGVQGFILGNELYSLNYDIDNNDGNILAYVCNSDLYDNDFTNISCNMEYNIPTMINYGVVVGYNLDDSTTTKDGNFKIIANLTSAQGTVNKEFEWHFSYGLEDEEEINYPVGISTDIKQELLSDTAGIGAINKINEQENISFDWLVEADLDKLTGENKAFNLWNLTENGTKDYTIEVGSNGANLDSSYNNEENPYNLKDNYVITSFYPQDDIEYNYLLEGNSYVLSQENDISLYSEKEVYIKIADDYELIGTYKKDENGNIVYVAVDDRTTSNNNVTANQPILLPEGTRELKVKYTGKRAGIYLGINFKTELVSNQDIISYVDTLDKNEVVLKNNSFIKYNEEMDNYNIATYLTLLTSNTYSNISSVINEKIDDNSSVSLTAYVYEQLNYGKLTLDEAKKMIVEQKNGTFYILLPKGAILDGELVVKKYGSNEDVQYEIEELTNYNDSLRTLLVIKINSDNNYYSNDNYIGSGYIVNYNLLYSDANNLAYGNNLYNDIAYVSGSSLSDGYINVSDASDSLFSDSVVKNLYKDLINDDTMKNKVFMTNNTLLDKIVVVEGKYEKNAKNEYELEFNSETVVAESNNYSYRLQYILGSDYEEISNVVFVDKIENSYVDNNYFKGILRDVDISYLKSIGVNPTIYYSTNVNVNLEDINLSGDDWSTNKPGNIGSVTAIAVDCGDYIFKGKENKAIHVDLLMQATNNYKDSLKAYNDAVLYYQSINNGSNNIIKSNMTEVSLDRATISLDATTNVGLGTYEQPAIVYKDLSYEIKINNSSNLYSYDNLKVEITIPNGIVVNNVEGISSLGNSYNNDYTFDNQLLVININELEANESIDIKITTSIDLDKIDFSQVLETEIILNELDNLSYDLSKTLYNKLEVPTLEYNKYAKTSDSIEFSDVSSLIIKKDEIYQYRVSVNNNSNVVANNLVVSDIVPDGLIVIEDSINNGGIYDADARTIIWNVSSLNAYENLNFEYSVQVPSDISLGTMYKSSAHISLVNPYDNSLKLYDDDTNIVSTLYQVVTDIKITNQLNGNLADKNKLFKYIIEVSGNVDNQGIYDVVNKDNDVVGVLEILEDGSGHYEGMILGDDSLTIRLLPGGIDYVIKQEKVLGYETSVNVSNSSLDNYVVVEGKTNEERMVNYLFTNVYDVNTSLDLEANVTYDKEISNQQFTLELSDNNGYVDQQVINSEGNVKFKTINFDNVEGQFVYYIKQIDLGEPKISYDMMTYKVVVNVTNDGEGNLNKEVKYYNKLDQLVDKITFNNTYIPNGLIIGNLNSSDYIDEDKTFNYHISLFGINGNYDVVDKNNNKITTLVSLDNGEINYDVSLKSDEQIKIVDVPKDVSYKIVQDIEDYYTVKLDNLNYQVDNENKQIIYTGITEDETMQIIFNNNYVTKGSFLPEVKVVLENNTLKDKDFKFMIKDISSGSSNGYIDYAYNNLEGDIVFKTINYNKPGKYLYEIVQVKGDSNHIYYDLSKCLLTIELLDNGDGTMKVISNVYEYLNNNNLFINKYSEEPIIAEDINKPNDINPETHDRVWIIGGLLGIVLILFVVEGRIKLRKYEMKI